MNNFYVYFLIDPRTNEPFYIGKGTDRRAWSHIRGNRGTKSKIKEDKIKSIRNNGFEPIVKLYKENMLEQDAYDLETTLIKQYGKIIDDTGILTNICDDNRPPVRNIPHKESTKRLMSERAKGRVFTEEHKKNMSIAHKHPTQPCSEEKKRKISKAQKGIPRTYCYKQIICLETNETFISVKAFLQYLRDSSLTVSTEWFYNSIRENGKYKAKNNKTYTYLNSQIKNIPLKDK